MKYFILIVFTFFLISCGDEKKSMPKDFDRSGKPQIITVHVYPDNKSMGQARKKHDGVADPGLLGWAVWTEQSPARCDIHVVRLRSSGDRSQMTSWGHELAHCVYGRFHDE